jgi:hypothetical protein
LTGPYGLITGQPQQPARLCPGASATRLRELASIQRRIGYRRLHILAGPEAIAMKQRMGPEALSKHGKLSDEFAIACGNRNMRAAHEI